MKKKILTAATVFAISLTNVCSGGTQPLITNNTVSAEEPASISSNSEGIGIEVGNVECFAGETVSVPLTLFGTSSPSCEILLNVNDPLEISDISSPLLSQFEADGSLLAIFSNSSGYADGSVIGKIEISVSYDAEPGEYPINISVELLDDNGDSVENPIGINGTVTVMDSEKYPFTYKKVDEDDDGIYDYIKITDCDESAETVDIPNEIDGLPVTSIGDAAFWACTSLESIEIPESVTSIGDRAFLPCSSLTSINVSENNSNYSSIDGVLFDKDKTELICFPRGSEKTEYIIPDSVTSIEDSAFYDCDSLTSIKIPNSVTSIGDSAFYDCDSLTSIKIPNSVTSIGDAAFESCNNLTSITIPDSVTSIGNSAFYECKSLTSIEIPESVTSIGDRAFLLCSSLTSINVSENNSNYSSIDGVLFDKDKTELICFPMGSEKTEYIIPDSVTSIEDSAFYDCDSLTSIKIPNSVTSIGDSAFEDCENLTSIAIENPECKIYDWRWTICNGYNEETGSYYNGVIRGYENSTSQAYAEKYGYEFESLGEKTLNISDLVKLQKYILKSETAISKRLDLNKDEIINIIDAVVLRRKLIYG